MGYSKKKNLYRYLIMRDGEVCGICDQSLSKEWNEYILYSRAVENKTRKPYKRKNINLDVDHIIPVYYIGERSFDDINNLQMSHRTCNAKKSNQFPTYPQV